MTFCLMLCIFKGYGHNNNPSVKEFQSCYKRLLIHHEIKAGGSGNCLSQDETIFLTVSKRIVKTSIDSSSVHQQRLFDESPLFEFERDEDDEYPLEILSGTSTEYQQNVITYIAGYVVKMVKKRISCNVCLSVLTVNDTESLKSSKFALLKAKNRGGLIFPSLDLITVCLETEKLLQKYRIRSSDSLPKHEGFAEKIAIAVLKSFSDKQI